MVEGLTSGAITEGQVAAFAMAVFFRGMDTRRARRADAGHARLRHACSTGRTSPARCVDKHSTGGVGDNVSLMLAPALAACGAYRADDLRPRPRPHRRHARQVRRHPRLRHPARRRDLPAASSREAGCAIIGQTADLAPADRRLYAIRDVTGTVESIDAHHRLDPVEEARRRPRRPGPRRQDRLRRLHGRRSTTPAALAESAGRRSPTAPGCRPRALITDMNEPLATAAGNALEVANAGALSARRRASTARLYDVTVGARRRAAGARPASRRRLDGGRGADAARPSPPARAAERFDRMVAALGGPTDFLDGFEAHLAARREIAEVAAGRDRLRRRHRHPRARPRRGRARRRPPPRPATRSTTRSASTGCSASAPRSSRTRRSRASTPADRGRPPPPRRGCAPPTASPRRRPPTTPLDPRARSPDAARVPPGDGFGRLRRRARRRRLRRRGRQHARPYRRGLRRGPRRERPLGAAPRANLAAPRPRRRRSAPPRGLDAGLRRDARRRSGPRPPRSPAARTRPPATGSSPACRCPGTGAISRAPTRRSRRSVTGPLIERARPARHALQRARLRHAGASTTSARSTSAPASRSSTPPPTACCRSPRTRRISASSGSTRSAASPPRSCTRCGIGRVIARPFVGETRGELRAHRATARTSPSRRPSRRSSTGWSPPAAATHAIGKIGDIFAHRGISTLAKGKDDMALFDATLAALDAAADGDLVFANFVDFDTLWGHRRDVSGYARALEAFDARLPEMLARLRPGDLADPHRRPRQRPDLPRHRPHPRAGAGARSPAWPPPRRSASSASPTSARPSPPTSASRPAATAGASCDRLMPYAFQMISIAPAAHARASDHRRPPAGPAQADASCASATPRPPASGGSCARSRCCSPTRSPATCR